MKNSFLSIFLLLGIFYLMIILSFLHSYSCENEKSIKQQNKEIIELRLKVDSMMLEKDTSFNLPWFLFKLSLINVESEFNVNAVNSISKAGGLYQILKSGGHLDEANRLMGYNMFCDSCRFNPLRATQIFEIVNNHHNPNKSHKRAARLHNPGDSLYWNKIQKNYRLFQQIAYEYK